MYKWLRNFYLDNFINGKINTFYIVPIGNNKKSQT